MGAVRPHELPGEPRLPYPGLAHHCNCLPVTHRGAFQRLPELLHFPVASAEALVAGRPVIASDSGGISELVESEVSGLLVEPGNSSLLVEALERFAGDPDLRRRLSEGARDAGRTRTMAHTAEAFDGILRQATEGRRLP